jgi:DnaJ-class molecular chaperone
MTSQKKTCKLCNGSGQISYFKGVSRFLLSEEECPECGGMGFTIVEKEKIKQTDDKCRDKKSS